MANLEHLKHFKNPEKAVELENKLIDGEITKEEFEKAIKELELWAEGEEIEFKSETDEELHKVEASSHLPQQDIKEIENQTHVVENLNEEKRQAHKITTYEHIKNVVSKWLKVAAGVVGLASFPNALEAQNKDIEEMNIGGHSVFVTKNPLNKELLNYYDSIEAYKFGQANLSKAFDQYNKIMNKNLTIPENLSDTFFIDPNADPKDTIFCEFHNHKKGGFHNEDYEKNMYKGITPEKVLHFRAFVPTATTYLTGENDVIEALYPIFPKPKKEMRYLPPLGTFNIQGQEFKYYSETQKNDILKKLESHGIKATKLSGGENYTVSRFQEKTTGWNDGKLYDKNKQVLINLNDYK